MEEEVGMEVGWAASEEHWAVDLTEVMVVWIWVVKWIRLGAKVLTKRCK